jgi:hypothetical protein
MSVLGFSAKLSGTNSTDSIVNIFIVEIAILDFPRRATLAGVDVRAYNETWASSIVLERNADGVEHI